MARKFGSPAKAGAQLGKLRLEKAAFRYNHLSTWAPASAGEQ